MAKAQPTSRLMSKLSTHSPRTIGHRSGHRRRPPEVSHLALEDVLGQGAGNRDQQTGGRGEEGGEGAGRHQPGQQFAAEPGEDPSGEGEHDGVGPLGHVEVGGVEAAEGAVDGGEDVEGAEQHQHDQRRLAGRPPVRVGVEADEDVGQAHRPEERGQHQRVGEEQRVAPLAADRSERSAPGAAVAVGLAGGVGSDGTGREGHLGPGADRVRPGRQCQPGRPRRRARRSGCRRARPGGGRAWPGRPRSGRRPARRRWSPSGTSEGRAR